VLRSWLAGFGARIGLFGQKRDQSLARTEHRVLQACGQKSTVGGQAQHGGLVQPCAQLGDRFVRVGAWAISLPSIAS
jgi:hypothetical protein